MESCEREQPSLAAVALSIRRYPLQFLGVSLLTGFLVGGGQRTRIGQELIGYAARHAVRQVAISALSEALRQS